MPTELAPTSSILGGLIKAIQADPELGPRWNELEALDKEVEAAAQHVMLDIAYSPVVMSGDDINDAIEVDYLGEDGNYHIRTGPSSFEKVPPEKLKLMRARYLILNGRRHQSLIDRFRSRR